MRLKPPPPCRGRLGHARRRLVFRWRVTLVLGITCGDLRYGLRTRQFTLAGADLALPPRERHLLETLILHAGTTVSRQALVDGLFGIDEEASADAIDLYVHRLRKKLEASSTTIVTLRGVGFLLRTRQD